MDAALILTRREAIQPRPPAPAAPPTWPRELLILCAPVWFRSSRFR